MLNDHMAELARIQHLAIPADPVDVPTTPAAPPSQAVSRNPLRPNYLNEMIGQERLRRLLARIIQTALAQYTAMDHMLLVAPSGVGKSTIAHIVANELGTNLFQVQAPVTLDKLMELRELMVDRDVLFIDEALALDTPIPTPTGWTTMGELSVGDMVLGANGRPVRVVNTTPVSLNASCFTVRLRDGTEIIADANHKWLASPKISNSTRYLTPRVVTTQQMADSGRPWRIPNPAPVELPAVDLPMDPYLFGQWLGNGNRKQLYINVRHSLADEVLVRARKSYADAKLLEAPISSGSLRRLSLGHGTGGPWGASPSDARRDFDSMGDAVWVDKCIPEIYLRGSIAQRLDLVRGLMDSDGSLTPSGTAVFSNTNLSILHGLAEILRSLGYNPTIKPTLSTELTRKTCWKLVFRPTPDRNPFLLRDAHRVIARKHKDEHRIVSITPTASVPVRCIAVDDPSHLFLAGTGMIPTHNCHLQSYGDRRGRTADNQAEVLFSLMEDRTLVTESGVYDFPYITVIGATTDEGQLPDAFINRFPLRPQIDPYDQAQLTTMAEENATALGCYIDPQAAKSYARACQQTPRVINNFVRASAAIAHVGGITVPLAQEVLTDMFGVTDDGLTPDQQKLLIFMVEHCKHTNAKGEIHYSAGLSTLATAIGKSRDVKSIQLRVEPFLIRRGYLQVGHGGRRLTDAGIKRGRQLLLNP